MKATDSDVKTYEYYKVDGRTVSQIGRIIDTLAWISDDYKCEENPMEHGDIVTILDVVCMALEGIDFTKVV